MLSSKKIHGSTYVRALLGKTVGQDGIINQIFRERVHSPESSPAKIWHVILHLVTPQLVVMTAWILFGIAECMTSRSSEFKSAPNLIVISEKICVLYLTSDLHDA